MVRVPGRWVRLRVVALSPRHSWWRVPLVSLLVRVVDVMVLLWLFVLPGVVVDDAPGDVDAAGGDANCVGVVGRRCVAPRCYWH